jgi:hypothetical protein
MSIVSKNNFNSLPNALIIGVQKSATTWLAKRLSQHPDIYMVPGEVHYFDWERNFAKGQKWYTSLFKDAVNQSIRCEKSGAYFWTTCEGVAGEPSNKPQRIKTLLPEAKLIVILRNPVNRAISGWNHNIRSGAICPSFDINRIFTAEYSQTVKRHGILSRGLYYRQLNDYLEHFRRDQILILFFETDILKNPAKGLRKATSFLGVNSDFAFKEISEAENKLESTKAGVWASYLSAGIVRKSIHQIDRHILRKLPLPKWCPAYPDKSVLNKLYEYYYAENIRLAELLGELPTEWNFSKPLLETA